MQLLAALLLIILIPYCFFCVIASVILFSLTLMGVIATVTSSMVLGLALLLFILKIIF